jgi:ribosome modulation factor
MTRTTIDNAVKRGMYGIEFTNGRRAAKDGKSRFDCPYNHAELRQGWFAGFDSVRLEEARAKLFPMTPEQSARKLHQS